MINVEIWASGSGTNADVICEYFQKSKTIKITRVCCNRLSAGVFHIAKKHNVPTFYFNNESWEAAALLDQLKESRADFIILAGFLKLVPVDVISAFAGKIINIHPSLLPKYGGKNMYGEYVHKAVLEAHERITGITIHEVNEEFDRGKILAQYTTSLESTDDLVIVKQKIQKLEHTHFAPTIEAWIQAKS